MKYIIATLAALALALGTSGAAEAKDTSWGKVKAPTHAKDTSWGKVQFKDTSWG